MTKTLCARGLRLLHHNPCPGEAGDRRARDVVWWHRDKARIVMVVWWLLTGAVHLAQADEAECFSNPSAELVAVETAFQPTQPSLLTNYRVAYRFLKIELRHLANATLWTTEGEWRPPGATRPIAACFVDLRLNSVAAETLEHRARMSVHNRIIAILTMPELKTLLYMKRFDEHLNPMLGRTRIVDTFERYDMQAGTLKYRREDYQAKTVVTNMAGADQLERQSREIMTALNTIAQVHKQNSLKAGTETNLTIQVNMNGQVVPVILALSSDKAPISFYGTVPAVIRIQAQPDRKAKVRPNDCRIWAMSFAEAATSLNNPTMMVLAGRAPVETMLPLTVDYELALGHIRCTLTGLTTTNLVYDLKEPAP